MKDSANNTRFGRIFPPREDWLASVEAETVIEPDLPIVDCHHHLWNRDGYRYFLEEFLEDTNSGHNIVATVYAECERYYRTRGPAKFYPVGEVEFANGMAAMSASGQFGPTRVNDAIVGYADLRLGDEIEEVLQAMIAVGGGRFRGIRWSNNWDADPIIGNGKSPVPGVYDTPSFRAGFRKLIDLDLSLDAWVFHTQLDDVINLARAFPEARIVMGHVGGVLGYGPYAGRRDEIFPVWQKSMKTLATCPNVSLKLGGTAMRMAAVDYGALARPPSSEDLATAWSPYFSECIELFGANRCMFESNFPVEKMLCSYRTIWNAFKRIATHASADEKADMFSGTASRFYRLE